VPTAMTFTSLQATLRKYIERGSVSDPDVYEMLPELINISERNIALDLNVTGIREIVTAVMVSGTSVYQKPSDWRRTVAINFGSGTTLDQRAGIFPRSYEYCRDYWPDDTVTSTPKFYSDYSDEYMLVAPTPDAAYPFELTYYARPRLLDEESETNWITENWPQLLLYATLREIAPFMKDDARIGTWDGMYQRLLQSITGDDLKKVVDRSVTRQEA